MLQLQSAKGKLIVEAIKITSKMQNYHKSNIDDVYFDNVGSKAPHRTNPTPPPWLLHKSMQAFPPMEVALAFASPLAEEEEEEEEVKSM